ncbi:RemK protein [Mycobacterium kansasii]|nr:methyltransferase [Mycobacterium kansasii]KZS68929.1 RemK protein [Mycobacterium kansasii]
MTTTHQRKLWWRHLISFLIAPVTMSLVIPALIVVASGVRAPDLHSPVAAGLATVGALLIAVGIGLLVSTVALFDRVGHGTLGVGNTLGEPVQLVVRGPYRHVHNPMISGVLSILLGAAAVAAAGWLLLRFATFWAVQVVTIRFWEEPHLRQRYGSEYVEYRRNVPGWIPRISAWR